MSSSDRSTTSHRDRFHSTPRPLHLHPRRLPHLFRLLRPHRRCRRAQKESEEAGEEEDRSAGTGKEGDPRRDAHLIWVNVHSS
ncbi:unnamed protein product [Urochloa humidicola]